MYKLLSYSLILIAPFKELKPIRVILSVFFVDILIAPFKELKPDRSHDSFIEDIKY